MPSNPTPRGRSKPRLRARAGTLALGGLVVLLVAVAAAGVTGPGDRWQSLRGAADAESALEAAFDPFAYRPDREDEFSRAARDGLAHVLYEKSPGGAIAAARRTARFRRQVERAASQTGADPDLLEAMVFLESAGRPEVIAGDDPEAAVGLVQILAETGQNLLGMRVDLARSRRLTRSIGRATARDRPATVRRLRARRRRIDERFDPAKATRAAGRYLRLARARFGREDLAVTSYHMGIGNLERVVRAYVRPGDASGDVDEVVDRHRVSYPRLYFDRSPVRNPATHRRLSALGDDSQNYWWKVLASREIMRLHREAPAGLERLVELHGAKATAEEVFHPEDETETFDDPGELRGAWLSGEIVPIPNSPETLWLRPARQLGDLASRLDQDRSLYRGLRPEALATLIYIADRVQSITGRSEALVVTSGVRDRSYQSLLVRRNTQAARGYSLHTTGYAFDVWRRYRSRAQARAFQFVLDRLRALAVIDYAVEPDAIHVTVSDRAEKLLPIVEDRIGAATG